MPIHYFHCTDGRELVLDTVGRRTSRRRVEPVAAQVAGRLMREASSSARWSEWLVTVQDQKVSLVTVVPFPAGRA